MAPLKVVNVHDAKTHFSKLLKRVGRGEEIVIASAGQPVARLSPIEAKQKLRVPGTARGLIVIRDDFDAALPDDLQKAFEE